jgi:hypothetical protein
VPGEIVQLGQPGAGEQVSSCLHDPRLEPRPQLRRFLNQLVNPFLDFPVEPRHGEVGDVMGLDVLNDGAICGAGDHGYAEPAPPDTPSRSTTRARRAPWALADVGKPP